MSQNTINWHATASIYKLTSTKTPSNRHATASITRLILPNYLQTARSSKHTYSLDPALRSLGIKKYGPPEPLPRLRNTTAPPSQAKK